MSVYVNMHTIYTCAQTFAKSMRKSSSTASITTSYTPPNWRGTRSIVTIVTTLCRSIPVWVMNGSWSRRETLLIKVIIEFVARGWDHSWAIVMEMRGHVWTRGGRGRVEWVGGLLIRWGTSMRPGIWRHVRILSLLNIQKQSVVYVLCIVVNYIISNYEWNWAS